MKIVITQEHVDRAIDKLDDIEYTRGLSQACPVAQCLKDMFPQKSYVSVGNIRCCVGNLYYTLSHELAMQVEQFGYLNREFKAGEYTLIEY